MKKWNNFIALRILLVSLILGASAQAQSIFSANFESDTLGAAPSGTWNISGTSATSYLTVETLASPSSSSNKALHFYDNDTVNQLGLSYQFSAYSGTSPVQLTFDLYFNSTLGTTTGYNMLMRLANSGSGTNFTGIWCAATSTSTVTIGAANSTSGYVAANIGQWYTISIVAAAPGSNASSQYTVTVKNTATGSVVGSITGVANTTELVNYARLNISGSTGGQSALLSDIYSASNTPSVSSRDVAEPESW